MIKNRKERERERKRGRTVWVFSKTQRKERVRSLWTSQLTSHHTVIVAACACMRKCMIMHEIMHISLCMYKRAGDGRMDGK